MVALEAKKSYISMLDDFFWAAFNQGIGIGSTDVEDTFSYSILWDHPEWVVDDAMYTVIDTGSSALIVSHYFFEDLIPTCRGSIKTYCKEAESFQVYVNGLSWNLGFSWLLNKQFNLDIAI